MTGILSRPLAPVVDDDDATETYRMLRPYLTDETRLFVVNVIEKAGGGIDKASVEQREAVADEAFAAITALAEEDGVQTTTGIHYGTDVAETIRAAADENDATSIVFTSRGGGRVMDFLSGSVRTKLVTNGDRPVIVLPNE